MEPCRGSNSHTAYSLAVKTGKLNLGWLFKMHLVTEDSVPLL